MPKRNESRRQAQNDAVELRNRLEETEETLRAIRQYMVDAFVVTRENGVQVVTLSEADFPYRMMVESMNEGAVTVISDGTIFYCNPRFAEMVHQEPQKLIGVRFVDLLPLEQRHDFLVMLRDAGREGLRGEYCLQAPNGICVPVQLSFFQLRANDANGIAVIATDITERRQAEEKIRTLASELAIAEQEERHRISQVLHDDLQQRLFAIRAQLSFLMESIGPMDKVTELQMSVDQIQSWLSEAIKITRDLSVDISPSVLHGEGIAEAMHWLGARMKEQHGLELELDAKDDFPHMPDHVRVTLFQAVRELLFNVVKHSGILHAVVTLEQVDGKCQLTVSDSGSGFDVHATMNDPQTHGLLVVQDRLKLMGGTIYVDSKPGDGTQIKIEIPIKDAAM